MFHISPSITTIVNIAGYDMKLLVEHIDDESGLKFYRCTIGKDKVVDLVRLVNGWEDLDTGESSLADILGAKIDELTN